MEHIALQMWVTLRVRPPANLAQMGSPANLAARLQLSHRGERKVS